MDVVCFGQQNWDKCWTGKQHLMTRLARRGHRVLYVDPTPTPARGPGAIFKTPGLAEYQPGLWIYTEQQPAYLGQRLGARLSAMKLRRIVDRLHMTAPIALVLNPFKRWLKESIRPVARMYYAIDEWTGYAGLKNLSGYLRREEDALLAEADVALAISPALVARFAPLQPRTHLLASAADVEHFSPASLERAASHPLLAGLPRPRIGFVGQIDHRLDQDLLLRVADARPDWQIILAGRAADGVDISRLTSRRNIRLTGYVPYADLPMVMREFDACIVPYQQTPLTHACSPLKVYEYLATGRPVVSAPLDGLGPCRDVVELAADAPAFVAALDRVLANPLAGRAQRLSFADRHNWDERTDRLEDYLDQALYVASARADRRPIRALSGREAAHAEPRLDAKDGGERQLKDDFTGYRISPAQRAFYFLTRAAGWAYFGARMARRLAMGKNPLAVEKILVVRRAYLGDLVAFLPTLAALRRKFPQAKIVLGGQANMAAAQMLAGSEDVDEVIELDFMSHPSRLARLRGAQRLFREGFDVLMCGVSYFLIREAYYCGAPRVVGLFDGHPLQHLSHKLAPLDPNRHEVENNLALAEIIGAQAQGAQRLPVLKIDAGDAARKLASRLNLPSSAKVILMHAGSKRPSRRWPTERFAELARRQLAARPTLHILLTGVADEQPLVDAILAALPADLRGRVHSAIGTPDFASLVALLDRADAVVCNDTGVMHVARARARPLLALLGPENDRRWGPHQLGHAPAIALRHEVPCAPCVRWTCEGHFCMKILGVDEASAALDELLDGVMPTRLPVLQLDRRLQRHGWRQLADAGHAMPGLAVVLGEKQAAPDLSDSYPPARIVAESDLFESFDSIEAEFISVWTGRTSPDAKRLSMDVAALYRSTDAAATDGTRIYNLDHVLNWPAEASGVTYRREALIALLKNRSFRAAGARI